MPKRLSKTILLMITALGMAACGNSTPDNLEGNQSEQNVAQVNAPTTTGEKGTTEDEPPVQSTAIYEANNTARIHDELYLSSSSENQSVVKASAGGLIKSSGSNFVKSGKSTDAGLSLSKGLNAAIIALDGGSIDLEDTLITTSAEGAGGIFSGGSDTSVAIRNGNINTQAGISPAITAGDGGYMECEKMAITTSGEKSAAVTAHNGSIIDLRGGEIKTTGQGSPSVSTSGKVRIEGSNLKADAAEAAIIKDNGSLTMIDTNIGGMSNNGVMIYRYADEAINGMATFGITGGSLSSLEGSLFHVANSSALITLNSTTIDAGSGIVLTAAAGEYGSKGHNGGHVTLSIRQQTLTGSIIADAISTVSFTMENNSTFTGMANADGKALLMDVSLDKTSVWDLTGDSYVSAFSDADASLVNIKDNGNSIYYEANNDANKWLGGKTYILQHGGKLTPSGE